MGDSDKEKSEKGSYDPYNLKLILSVLLLIQAILAVVVFFVPPFSGLGLNQQINIFLTFAIVEFTVVGASSTWLQYAVIEKRNKIEDLRNELKEAYGSIYTLLNKPPLKDGGIRLWKEEKRVLDELMTKYPFMFPTKLIDFWRDDIEYMDITGTGTRFEGPSAYYDIPENFVLLFLEEYFKKINRYNEILKKKDMKIRYM